MVGLLQAQFTLTGYDSSAHLSEETHNAEVSGPVGMTMAIIGMFAVLIEAVNEILGAQ